MVLFLLFFSSRSALSQGCGGAHLCHANTMAVQGEAAGHRGVHVSFVFFGQTMLLFAISRQPLLLLVGHVDSAALSEQLDESDSHDLFFQEPSHFGSSISRPPPWTEGHTRASGSAKILVGSTSQVYQTASRSCGPLQRGNRCRGSAFLECPSTSCPRARQGGRGLSTGKSRLRAERSLQTSLQTSTDC